MIKNSKIEPNEKNVDVVINPGVIKTQTPAPEGKADQGESNMPNGDKPTGDENDTILGNK